MCCGIALKMRDILWQMLYSFVEATQRVMQFFRAAKQNLPTTWLSQDKHSAHVSNSAHFFTFAVMHGRMTKTPPPTIAAWLPQKC